MSDPIEVVGERIARLAWVDAPGIGRLGPGPVLTVVRDTASGKIYVGLNTGIPEKLTEVLYKNILKHKATIWKGEVIVVRSDPSAVGGHSEVNALNPAIRDREKVLGRKLTEKDLGVFELHNVWLRGERSTKAAPRCEHCAKITRGVAVSQSVFVAEGGVVGKINVPQRGSVTPAGGGGGKPVTTASGEINVPQRGSVTPAGGGGGKPVTTASGEINVPQRGSVTPAGGGGGKPVTTASGSMGGRGGGFAAPMVGGLLTGVAVLALPALKKWFADNYLSAKWTAEARAMVVEAIEGSIYKYNFLIIARTPDIQKEKNAGRQVKLRIDVDTEWVGTDFGPAQIKADVSDYYLVFEGDTEIEWPVFQWHYGFISDLFKTARITARRDTYYLVL